MDINKEFYSISNINDGYKKASQIALLSVIGMIACAIIFGYLYKKNVDNVLENRLVVVATDLGTYQIIDKNAQAKAHCINFHKLFFQIDPFNYKKNVENSFNLIDINDGKRLYDIYKSHNWFSDVVKNNIIVGVDVDSVKASVIDDNEKREIIFYGKQLLRSKDEIEIRNLITKMKTQNVSNSEENPFGLIIYDFSIINNEKIITKTSTEMLEEKSKIN